MGRAAETEMPLYPSEEQIARAVLGPGKVRQWPGLAVVLERQGLPRVDEQFGGRYWPAVRAFLDRRHNVHHAAPDLGEDRHGRRAVRARA
jgi:hypothetical protein